MQCMVNTGFVVCNLNISCSSHPADLCCMLLWTLAGSTQKRRKISHAINLAVYATFSFSFFLLSVAWTAVLCFWSQWSQIIEVGGSTKSAAAATCKQVRSRESALVHASTVSQTVRPWGRRDCDCHVHRSHNHYLSVSGRHDSRQQDRHAPRPGRQRVSSLGDVIATSRGR